MVADEIRRVILDILSRIQPDEDLSGLVDDVPFREQLELDSMDFLDIVMELRKQYRVQIPEEDYENLATMAGTVSYLEPLLKDVCYIDAKRDTKKSCPLGHECASNASDCPQCGHQFA